MAETGKCLEGLPLDKCPTFDKGIQIPAATAEAVHPASEVSEASANDAVPLHSGDLLDRGEAGRIARANVTRLIAVVGPNEAGKTSLIASLYEQFQLGNFVGCAFRWSHTLQGFERACHHARAVSRRAQPFTERTHRGSGLKFYHVGLRAPSNEPLDVLLADRAGEEYKGVADDPSVAAGFIEITRADSITVLVDGRRLADSAARHNARAEVELTLQGLVDSDAMGEVRRLAIVLTKLDLVHQSPRRAQTEASFAGLVGEIRNRFGSHVQDITSFETAACPDSDALPRGHGVAEVFKYWMGTAAARSGDTSAELPARFFQRLSCSEKMLE